MWEYICLCTNENFCATKRPQYTLVLFSLSFKFSSFFFFLFSNHNHQNFNIFRMRVRKNLKMSLTKYIDRTASYSFGSNVFFFFSLRFSSFQSANRQNLVLKSIFNRVSQDVIKLFSFSTNCVQSKNDRRKCSI